MPSFAQDITDGRIIVTVDVSREVGQPRTSYRALLDTGAQISAISTEVVRALDLSPVSLATLSVVSGSSFVTPRYLARLDIPIDVNWAASAGTQRFLMGRQLSVAGIPYRPPDYDVIMGMDLIGTFHITMYGNRIILSN